MKMWRDGIQANNFSNGQRTGGFLADQSCRILRPLVVSVGNCWFVVAERWLCRSVSPGPGTMDGDAPNGCCRSSQLTAVGAL